MGILCPTQWEGTSDVRCHDNVDCDDVATNNYEQILGLAFDLVDGPNFHSDCFIDNSNCGGSSAAFDMTWAYVVCHHGESDYEPDCDKTAPGETGAVDITPDAVTNVIVLDDMVDELTKRGASVSCLDLYNPGDNQYLVVNPNFDGDTDNRLTLASSTIPPGIDEMLDGNEPASTSASCMDSQPECDTIHLYMEWMPNDLEDMFNVNDIGANCDQTGNIMEGNAAEIANEQNYFVRPSLENSYVPVNGYQNPGTVGAIEGPPNEVATFGLDPDPEFGDCNSSAFATCSAGPGEDCSGYGFSLGYYSDINVQKNTLMVEPNFSDPCLFDVTFELIVTNVGQVNLVNPVLTDDLFMTFNNLPGAYNLPLVTPPTIDTGCIPAPNHPGGGFPIANAAYDGNPAGDIEVLNGNGGVIEPGEKIRITFEVTVNQCVVGDDEYINQTQVNSPDCFGLDATDIWCVGDTSTSTLMLFSIDIALQKTTVTPPPYSLGQTVTFDIEVINQGGSDLQNIEITDHIPCGFAYSPSNNPTWTQTGSTATTTIPALAAGASTNVQIDMIIQECSTPVDAWTNVAEVSYMEDEFGRDVSMADVDSMADSDPSNDAGGDPGSAADDVVNGNGTGSPGGEDPLTDEDDADPEMLPIFDLALEKLLDTPAPYTVGDDLTFTINVYNQGNQDVTDVEVTDYLPAGYIFDPALNPDWMLVGGVLVTTIPGPVAPGAIVPIPLVLELQAGSGSADDWYNEAEISSFADENGDPAIDWDSTADNDPNNDNDVVVDGPDDNVIDENTTTGTDEDDNDPAEPQIPDAALSKVILEPAPYTYGQVITFSIDVTNQGNIPLTNIEVIDFLPCGFSFVGGNVPWAFLGGNYVTTIDGPLAPGDTETVTLTAEIIFCDQADAWTNFSEIASMQDGDGNTVNDIDSTPDSDPSNDAGGEPGGPTDDQTNGDGTGTPGGGDPANDEDDQDPVFVEVFDLALSKVLATPPPYTYGQTVVFDIEVLNQGNVAATDVVITDYIPVGYLYDPNAPLNVANGWGVGPNPTTTITGPMAPMSTTTIQIELTLQAISGATDAWTNFAEISAANDANGLPATDADSTADSDPSNDPGGELNGPSDDATSGDGTGPVDGGDETNDEDDSDPAGVEIFDLALIKTTAETGPFSYGDLVPFEITVYNQGSIPATNTEVIDYIPCGYMFSPTNFPLWIFDAADSEATTTISGPLAPGGSETVTILLEVIACTTSDAWLNYSEILAADDGDGNPATDIDSTSDGDEGNDAGGVANSSSDDQLDGDGVNDEDDHDPELIEIFDLALIKETTSPPAQYGDHITYTMTVFNQGNIAATDVEVVDYLPAGLVYDPAHPINVANGWVLSPDPTTLIPGPIAPGASASVEIAVIFTQTGGGVEDWYNYGEIASANDPDGNPGNDADSTADNDPNNDNDIIPNDPDDDNPNGGGPNAGEDEDDHDPEGIFDVVDVALAKTTMDQAPFVPGQIVTFDL